MRVHKLFNIFSVICIGAALTSCGPKDYTPKPRGYFRIGLPEKSYRLLDSVFPYTFEYPEYAYIEPDNNTNSEPYWINLVYPGFRARLHLSYKAVNGNLYQYFEDARNFVNKHIPKANDIRTREYTNDSARVYGLVYEISGAGVASVYQFCVTDSSKHYLRGALYFDVVPNNDSLAPVISFLKKDIDYMISSIRWKDNY